LFFILFGFLFLPAHAQVNYVLNPSLEQHTQCPDNFDEINFANYWSGLDSLQIYQNMSDGEPEYCNVCATNWQLSIPQGVYYYHYARTGNGMAQVVMYNDESVPVNLYLRDYLQGRLFKQLTANKSYCVTFYVVEAQASSYSVNHIGAYLDNGIIDTTTDPGGVQDQYTPQILENAIISDTLNWVKIEGSFIANGTEKFITIGNFFDTAHTAHVVFNPNGVPTYAVYLVDDVSVIESDHVAFAGNDTTIAQGDSILLGEIAVPYVWYKDSSGILSLIDSTSGFIMAKPDTTTTYVVKQTLCGVVTSDTVVVSVVPVNVVNVMNMKNVFVYPNPVQNELIIENAENCIVQIFDVVGREVYSGVIEQKNQTINTSYFSRGTYFLEIKSSDGERIIKKIVK